MGKKKGRGKNMTINFADFIAQHEDEIRRQSNSITTKKVNGVPVITPDDEWYDQKEWDEMYDSLKGKQ